MNIQIGSYNAHFQIVPLFGIALGYLYYTPEQEEDFDIEEEDNYSRHQVLFLLFALVVTVWKS